MPLGGQEWVNAGPPIRGGVLAPPLGAGGLPPNGQPLNGPGANVWKNFTLYAAAGDWSGPQSIDFGTPISVLEVFCGPEDQMYIGWNGNVGANPGEYNLWHPGNGQIVEVVPDIRSIWYITAALAAPTDRIEVVGKGGRYGVPSGAWPNVPTGLMPGGGE